MRRLRNLRQEPGSRAGIEENQPEKYDDQGTGIAERLKVSKRGDLKSFSKNEAACIGCKKYQKNCHKKTIKIIK